MEDKKVKIKVIVKEAEKETKLKSIIGKIERHWVVVSAFGSIAFLLITKLFYLVQQQYDNGYYGFWGIPTTYIESSHVLRLSEIIQYLAMIIVIFIVCNLYRYYFFKLSNKENSVIKWLIRGIMVVLLWMLGILALFLSICSEIGIKGTWQECTKNPALIAWNAIPIGIAFGGLILISINWWEIPCKEEKEESNENPTNWKGKRLKSSILLGVLFIFIGILGISYSIYTAGENAANSTKALDVVKIDGKKYAAIIQYKDSWILKEVLYNDEIINNESKKSFRIVENHYMIYDIQGLDVIHFNIQGEDISEHFTQDERL